MSSVSTQKLLFWRVSLNLYINVRFFFYYFYFLKHLPILIVSKCKNIYIYFFNKSSAFTLYESTERAVGLREVLQNVGMEILNELESVKKYLKELLN